MRLERRTEALISATQFLARQVRYAIAAGIMVAVSLGIGVLGYHLIAGLAWIDALLNASFILTGMGPVDTLRTAGAKLFASAYAIFSGVAFLSTIGVLMTPIAHRLLHQFHVEGGHGGR